MCAAKRSTVEARKLKSVASGDIVYLSNVSAKDVAIEKTWRLIGSVLAQAAGRLSNAAVR